MACVSFSDRYDAFDVTPIENLFIDEYMLRAPGEFVKVYLLGLRMCYRPDPGHSLDSIARTLEIEPETVRAALSYWEREGIVRRVSDAPPQYAFGNLKEMLLTRGAVSQDLYGYQDFNRRLQTIFGDKRLLHPQDLVAIYDWIEVVGLSREAVLLLIGHCLETRGARCTLAKMGKLAVEWAEQGITTADTAERHLRDIAKMSQGARSVLSDLGIRRNPTVAEEHLYGKWTGVWGFDLEAIRAALERTASAREPSFTYVDRILENLYKSGAKTAEAVRRQPRKASPASAPLRAVGAPPPGRASKEVAEHRYNQRSYTNEELLALFDDGTDSGKKVQP